MATGITYSIVLLGRFPGKDRIVASTLARDFGRDDAWGSQVIGAAPIILLDNLSIEQAESIEAALADVEAAGSRLEVQQGTDPGISKLSWPSPPRIKGKLVSEFGGVGGAAAGSVSTATLLVPCPYTGQKIKLTITVSLSRVADQPVVASIAASATAAAAAPVAIPVPSPMSRNTPNTVEAAYKPIPTPVVTPRVPVPAPAPPQSRRLTPASGSSQPVIIGLEDLDELKPMEQFPAPVPSASGSAARPTAAGSQARPVNPTPPRPIPAPRPTNPAIPLPDVPVLHNQAAPAPAAQPLNNLAPMPDDLMSAPMDLSAFEAGVSASGIMSASTAQVSDGESGGDDGSLCSISIGKSTNPKVHQIVADICGLSVGEAARLCQKPIVTLAKDISSSEAQNIKQQLAAVNVVAKITARRA